MTWRRHNGFRRFVLSVNVEDFFKLLLAVFAQWAFDVVGEEIALVNIAAHLAFPAAFAIAGLLGLGFGLDVVLIIIVGQRRLVGQHLSVEHITDKHGVCPEVDAFVDATC